MPHYSIQFELLVDDLAEWGPESIMVLNNYISVPSESAQRAATKLLTANIVISTNRFEPFCTTSLTSLGWSSMNYDAAESLFKWAVRWEASSPCSWTMRRPPTSLLYGMILSRLWSFEALVVQVVPLILEDCWQDLGIQILEEAKMVNPAISSVWCVAYL